MAFGADRVFLQMAPVAFDASTFEIWGALLHGARLRGHAGRIVPTCGAGRGDRSATVSRPLAHLRRSSTPMVDEDVPARSRACEQLLVGGDVLLARRMSPGVSRPSPASG